jgi:hypothetical protein
MLQLETRPLILANLRRKDFRRFKEACIPYSGTTGFCDPDLYRGNVAPYIASFASEFLRAVKALRWKDFEVELEAHQVTVRRRRKS